MLYFICIAQFFLTLLAYILGFLSQNFSPIQHTFTRTGLFLGAILYSFLSYRFLKDIRKMHRRSAIARSLLSVLSDADEVIIVDENMRIVYAKYLSSSSGNYDSVFDFNALILDQFIDHDHALNRFQESLIQGQYFEDVFQTKQIHNFDPENHIWIRVLPLYATPNAAQHYRAIILSDITLHQAHLDPSKKQDRPDQTLEKYLDFAPFGFIYTNSNGQILGFNQTLKNWIGSSKEPFIGASLSSITDIAPNKLNSVLQAKSPLQIRIKPSRIDQTSATLFSTKISDDYYIVALCRQDSNQTQLPVKDPLNQLPIPSLLLNSSGDISALNMNFFPLFTPQYRREHRISVGDNLIQYIDEASKGALSAALSNLPFHATAVALDIQFSHEGPSVMAYIQNIGDGKFLLQLINISEQKKLEKQFVQAQKTQAVGQLAGGIAHDFNNLLTAMIGFCDLLLQRVVPNDPSYTDIMHIKQNANRASNLVRQLLAFSRRQSLQPRKINITDSLSEISALLRRLIGSQINFTVSHARNLWPIKVDASQFEQVIINILVNARDAMPSGGNLSIQTSNYTNATSLTIGNDVLTSGDYIVIKITDTGCGMTPATMGSIFEPFFSTKEVGAGTGLGLATAYGIVKQTGGAISVESTVGKGTTFKIFLPRCKDKDPIILPAKEIPVRDITGDETILLVEDEDAIRIFAGRALRDKGYRVLEASNGEEALSLVMEGIRPDVLITDVVMPKMDGPTLRQKIKEIIPNLPVVFTSGYAEETFRKDLYEDHSIHFLSKPFTLRDLATKVRQVLQ